ncbi:MAG: hypothetical protein ACRD9Y_23010, partial [Blastocatellia bacterium]
YNPPDPEANLAPDDCEGGKAMNAVLERVTEAVKILPPEDLLELRDLVDSLLEDAQAAKQPQMTEDEFEQYLAEQGFLREAPAPVNDLSPYENYQLIEVTGQPTSEMIVEERR